MAAALLPSLGPKRRRKCYIIGACILGGPQLNGGKMRSGYLTPAFWGVQKRAQMLHHPYVLGEPQIKGDKIRSGYLTLAISGAQKRAKMLPHPCLLGDP